MILGTANFGRNYNNSFIEKNKCFKLLEAYENMGGKLIDTAPNYSDAQDIVIEYIKAGSNLSIITKVWDLHDITDELYKSDYLHAVLCRGNNKNLIEDLRYEYESGYLKKMGQSIYYPQELDQRCNIISIPMWYCFDQYLPVMQLHSKVYARSFYNLYMKNVQTYYEINDMGDLRDRVDYDISKYDDIILGVDNINQLREGMAIL
jgi:hypothetical protein